MLWGERNKSLSIYLLLLALFILVYIYFFLFLLERLVMSSQNPIVPPSTLELLPSFPWGRLVRCHRLGGWTSSQRGNRKSWHLKGGNVNVLLNKVQVFSPLSLNQLFFFFLIILPAGLWCWALGRGMFVLNWLKSRKYIFCCCLVSVEFLFMEFGIGTRKNWVYNLVRSIEVDSISN